MAYNFNPGPAAIPKAVLQRVQTELVDYQDTGLSLIEHSHRSKVYEKVHFDTIAKVKSLLKVPDNYEILLIGGGASLQFPMIPMNFLKTGDTAGYVVSGYWAKRAMDEALKVRPLVYECATSEKEAFKILPTKFELKPETKYVHLTSNNTIYGSQWKELPKFGPLMPLVCDMTSDILSKEINYQDIGLIYASSQKNLGPAGVTLVILRKDLVKSAASVPPILSYEAFVKQQSLLNTPPGFAVYMMNYMLDWIGEQGGLTEMKRRSEVRSNLLYSVIDKYADYYLAYVRPEARSLMNVTFNLKTKELEEKFIKEAEEKGFIGIRGHRQIGGIRVSIYNGMAIEGVEKFAAFMEQFQQLNPVKALELANV